MSDPMYIYNKNIQEVNLIINFSELTWKSPLTYTSVVRYNKAVHNQLFVLYFKYIFYILPSNEFSQHVGD